MASSSVLVRLGPFAVPVGASSAFVAVLVSGPLVLATGGPHFLVSLATGFFVGILASLFLFAPVAFAVALVVKQWKARVAVAGIVVLVLSLLATLSVASGGLPKVPAGAEGFAVVLVAAAGLVACVGQVIFVAAWAHVSPNPPPGPAA
jgi:hypothetical protein